MTDALPATYTGRLATDLDRVRFLVSDTAAPFHLTDNEIEFLLAEELDIYAAAVQAARTIARNFSSLADRSIGDLHISYGARATTYNAMAASLERRAMRARVPTPIATGISVADKVSAEQDEAMVQPSFRKGQDDNHSTVIRRDSWEIQNR